MTKWIQRLVIATFCLLISLPLGLTLLGIRSVSSENRTLAEAPSLAEAGTNFSNEFETYYNDTFPLRTELVRLNSWLSLNLLNTAPGTQVIAGKDHFLFFAETVPDYSGTREVSDAYLQDLTAQLLAIQNAFAEHGSTFVLAIAPNKNSVYPEYMPSVYSRTQHSMYDRLLPLLQSAGVNAPDLKAALLASKSSGLLYHKLDTHWNDRGALVAYRAIVETTMSQSEGLQMPLYPYLTFGEQTFVGDLASTMLGLSGKETAPAHSLNAFYASDTDFYAPKLTTEYTESAHIMVYRDSFGTALVPYFAQGSARAYFTRALPYDFNAAEGADVVVLEIAERNLDTLLAELSVPTLQGGVSIDPLESTAPEDPEVVAELGADIPTPEPFDKSLLPAALDEIPNRADEWDDYDPFSEPPGPTLPTGTPSTPSDDDQAQDIADFRLLIATDKESAVISVLGNVSSGTLTVRSTEGGSPQFSTLLNGQFHLFQLQAGKTYAARATIDGTAYDFLLQTQPADSAASQLQAVCLDSGLELTWQGKAEATYRVYRSSFLEGEWEMVAEVTGSRALLPYADTLQANYKIVQSRSGAEYGWSAPVTLMTPVLGLPSSDESLDQEYLPLISRSGQIFFIMAKDIDGKYSIPVRAMLTSTGKSESRTPTGTYEIWEKREWFRWTDLQYSQYNLYFASALKIHSILFSDQSHDDPIFNMRAYLGQPVSGGCLRLTVTDAKWVYEHFGIEDSLVVVEGSRLPTLWQELKDTLPAL